MSVCLQEPENPETSFDNGVRQLLETQGHIEAKGPGRLHIDDQFELDRGLHGKLAWLLALEDAVDIARGKPKFIALLAPIGQQAALLGEETPGIDGRKTI